MYVPAEGVEVAAGGGAAAVLKLVPTARGNGGLEI